MAITGKIQWDPGALVVSSKGSSSQLRYWIFGDHPDDERDDAMSWLVTNAPGFLFNLIPERFEITRYIREGTLDPADPTNALLEGAEHLWEARVEYVDQSRDQKPLNLDDDKGKDEKQDVRISIRSGSGQRVNRKYSEEFRQEIFRRPSGSDPSPYNWATQDGALNEDVERVIGVKAEEDAGNGAMFTVEGIDQTIGTVELIVETIRPAVNITEDGYLVKACRLAAKNVINDKVYKGFPIQSLKLVNVDAQQQTTFDSADSTVNVRPWEITYTMEIGEERTVKEMNDTRPPGLTAQDSRWEGEIQPGDPGADEEVIFFGHDYLDVLWQDHTVLSSGGTASFILPIARRAAIHRMFEKVDFAQELII